MAAEGRRDDMIENRSVPAATVIPVLSYEDVSEASRWLCETFGFRERLRIENHRIQMHIGEGGGAVILKQQPTSQGPHPCHSVLVRVADADSHYERAKQHGAHITQPPESYPFGERQYSVEDSGGHIWTFSQSIADVAPEDWGGTAIDLR